METRSKYDFHKNDLPNQYPENYDWFKFVGVLTDPDTDLMRLRGKPLSFKSQTKGSVDIVIRNGEEFKEFLKQGRFTRQSLYSLVAQTFDPLCCLNGVFLCIARLVNRLCIMDYEGTMPLKFPIDKKHFPKLEKVVNMYFRIQTLQLRRYLLMRDVPLDCMENTIIAFSDGSSEFATSAVYLLSKDKRNNNYTINLVSTLCKIAEPSKGKDLEAVMLTTVPKTEGHGLFLATSGIVILSEVLVKLAIPITKMFIFTDAISHILALRKSPHLFVAPYKRYYSEILSMLTKLRETTGQDVQEFIFWIDQERWPNPADLLSKFDVINDDVELWMERAEGVLRPPWLQEHPDTYLDQMLIRSKEKVDFQNTGGGGWCTGAEVAKNSRDAIVHTAYCQYVIASDPITQVSRSPKSSNAKILEYLVNKYRGYYPNVALRILGRIVLIAHNWQARTLINRYKGGFKCAREHIATYESLNRFKSQVRCAHKDVNCVCIKRALEGIVRPYISDPIFPPYLRNGRWVRANDADRRFLAQLGLFFGALLTAELVQKVRMKHLTNYGEGFIVYNDLKCKVLSGRQVRFKAIVNPTRHKIYIIQHDSPLVNLALREAHAKIGCGNGIEQYVTHIQLLGIASPGLHSVVQQFRDACPGCLQHNMFFSGKSPYANAILKQHGPDDLTSATVNADPLSTIIVDETGPFFYEDRYDSAKHHSVHVLISVELVTYRCHLIVVNGMTAPDVVKGLEILQSRRGTLINIVMDHATSHVALQRKGVKDGRSILTKILEGNSDLLGAAGIKISVAPGKRHEKVGRCERVVYQVKRLLLNKIGSHIYHDYFDVTHKMALVQLLINERPVFFHGNRVLTPYCVDSALLRRNSTPIKVFTLSDFIYPADKDMRGLINELATESREILNLVASEQANMLLNRKPINQNISLGELVYIPDLIKAKNPHSILGALAKVKATVDNRNFECVLLNGNSVTRHVSALVSTRANISNTMVQNVDPFQLPQVSDIILPNEVISDFDANLPKFTDDIHDGEDDDLKDVNAVKESVLPLFPSDAGVDDAVVPIVINDVLSDADKRQEKQSAEVLQRKMNDAVKEPVTSLGEHSDFDLSWKKRPSYYKAKAAGKSTVGGRGRGRPRGRGRGRGQRRSEESVPGGEAGALDENEKQIQDYDGHQEKVVVPPVIEGSSVKEKKDKDSDWIPPKTVPIITISDDPFPRRVLRPRKQRLSSMESIPEDEGEMETGSKTTVDKVEETTVDTTEQEVRADDIVVNNAQENAGKKIAEDTTDIVMVDSEKTVSENKEVKKKKKKKKKRPKEVWYTKQQISEL